MEKVIVGWTLLADQVLLLSVPMAQVCEVWSRGWRLSDRRGGRADLSKHCAGPQILGELWAEGTFVLSVALRFRSEERSYREGDALLAPLPEPPYGVLQSILCSTRFLFRKDASNQGGTAFSLQCCVSDRSPSPLVVTVTFLCLSRPRSSGAPCFLTPLTCTSLPVLQGQNQGRCPPAPTIPCTCMPLIFAVDSSRMETCSLMHLILSLDCEPLESRYFCLNQLRMSIYLFILVSLASQRIGVWLFLAQNKCSVTVKQVMTCFLT